MAQNSMLQLLFVWNRIDEFCSTANTGTARGSLSPTTDDEDKSEIPGIRRDQDSLTKYLRSRSQHVDATEVTTCLGYLYSCRTPDPAGFPPCPHPISECFQKAESIPDQITRIDRQTQSSVQAKAGSTADDCSSHDEIAASTNEHISTADEDHMYIGGWCSGKKNKSESNESDKAGEGNPGLEEANDVSKGRT